ncbi:unnamed protein product [Pylaiella littoralis]
MRTPITMKGFPRGLLLLSLSAWPVGCFITYTSSTAQQQLRPAGGGRCVNRPLQQKHQQQRLQLTRNRGTLEACPCPPSKAVDASLVGLRGQRRLSETSIGESAARMTRLRQGVRLFASAGDEGGEGEETGAGGTKKETKMEMEMEMEMDGGYTPEEREFIRNFHAENEAAEEPADEDELEPYSHDYKMYAGEEGSMNIEWDAAMGMFDSWDLPPIEDFDPMVLPTHHKYYEDDLQANLRSEVNPFTLHSPWVDRDIKVGEIDEDKKDAIQPMISVIEQVCELIDTTDDVFSFKYVGPIRHKKGIASWAMVLIKPLYPEVKGVNFVTNRTRDRTDW